MDPRNRLLSQVLDGAATLHRIAERLDAVSDATELPFNSSEQQQLSSSVGNVVQLLLTGEALLDQEVQRWGL